MQHQKMMNLPRLLLPISALELLTLIAVLSTDSAFAVSKGPEEMPVDTLELRAESPTTSTMQPRHLRRPITRNSGAIIFSIIAATAAIFMVVSCYAFLTRNRLGQINVRVLSAPDDEDGGCDSSDDEDIKDIKALLGQLKLKADSSKTTKEHMGEPEKETNSQGIDKAAVEEDSDEGGASGSNEEIERKDPAAIETDANSIRGVRGGSSWIRKAQLLGAVLASQIALGGSSKADNPVFIDILRFIEDKPRNITDMDYSAFLQQLDGSDRDFITHLVYFLDGSGEYYGNPNGPKLMQKLNLKNGGFTKLMLNELFYTPLAKLSKKFYKYLPATLNLMFDARVESFIERSNRGLIPELMPHPRLTGLEDLEVGQRALATKLRLEKINQVMKEESLAGHTTRLFHRFILEIIEYVNHAIDEVNYASALNAYYTNREIDMAVDPERKYEEAFPVDSYSEKWLPRFPADRNHVRAKRSFIGKKIIKAAFRIHSHPASHVWEHNEGSSGYMWEALQFGQKVNETLAKALEELQQENTQRTTKFMKVLEKTISVAEERLNLFHDVAASQLTDSQNKADIAMNNVLSLLENFEEIKQKVANESGKLDEMVGQVGQMSGQMVKLDDNLNSTQELRSLLSNLTLSFEQFREQMQDMLPTSLSATVNNNTSAGATNNTTQPSHGHSTFMSPIVTSALENFSRKLQELSHSRLNISSLLADAINNATATLATATTTENNTSSSNNLAEQQPEQQHRHPFAFYFPGNNIVTGVTVGILTAGLAIATAGLIYANRKLRRTRSRADVELGSDADLLRQLLVRLDKLEQADREKRDEDVRIKAAALEEEMDELQVNMEGKKNREEKEGLRRIRQRRLERAIKAVVQRELREQRMRDTIIERDADGASSHGEREEEAYDSDDSSNETVAMLR